MWAHKEGSQPEHKAIEHSEIRRTLSGAIADQELMFEQERFSCDLARAARAEEFREGHEQMDRQEEQIAHELKLSCRPICARLHHGGDLCQSCQFATHSCRREARSEGTGPSARRSSLHLLDDALVFECKSCFSLASIEDRRMHYRHLCYFVRIVEAGSFSQAARTIHVAQPALSQQIAELEASLGVPLLQRSARGIRPTAAGQRFYEEASLILRRYENLPRLVRSGIGEIEGVVSVGMAGSLSTTLV